jgi:hypothetical protein
MPAPPPGEVTLTDSPGTGPHGGEQPARHGRGSLPKLFALLAGAIALVATAFVAFGSSSNSALDPVAQAATVSSNSPGFRMRMTISVQGSALPSGFVASGGGSFDPKARTGSLTFSADVPQHGTQRFQEILSGDIVYVKLPADITNALPGVDKQWASVDLSKLSGIPGLSALANNPTSGDPSQMLQYLRAASDSVVAEGHARVGGVETTQYHAQLDLDRVAGALPSSVRAAAQQALSTLESQTGLHGFPVDVWVDRHHLVRRLTMSLHATPSNGQSLDESMTMDITHYGPQPQPTVPPSDRVMNLDSLIGSGG